MPFVHSCEHCAELKVIHNPAFKALQDVCSSIKLGAPPTYSEGDTCLSAGTVICMIATLCCAGLNTGSVLIRNTDWARALAEEMASYGKYPIDWGKEDLMRAALPSYDIGMYEQNMLVYTIMHDPSIMAKARQLPACIHCMCCQPCN